MYSPKTFDVALLGSGIELFNVRKKTSPQTVLYMSMSKINCLVSNSCSWKYRLLLSCTEPDFSPHAALNKTLLTVVMAENPQVELH